MAFSSQDNSPDPYEIDMPPLPRSGIAHGDSHSGWRCCRPTLLEMRDLVDIKTLTDPQKYSQMLYFLNKALANSILTVVSDTPKLEEIEYVVFIKRMWIKGESSARDKCYWFARDGGDEFIEIRSYQFHSLTGMRSLGSEMVGCSRKECAGKSPLWHHLEMFKREKPMKKSPPPPPSAKSKG